MWLALDPIDEENGALRYVPKSHHDGLRPHGQTSVIGFSQGITDYGSKDKEVLISLKPGDLVCHHGETIHRANTNRSTTCSRRAFSLAYQGVSCQRDNEAYENYMSYLQAQHAVAGISKP